VFAELLDQRYEDGSAPADWLGNHRLLLKRLPLLS